MRTRPAVAPAPPAPVAESAPARARARRSSRHPAYVDLAGAYESVGSERAWFAEGAWEGNPLVVLAGPEKKGKSWALAQFAVATVTGGAWLGAFPIRRTGSVVVLDAEYGPHEYARRVARIARAEGRDPREVLAAVRYYYGPLPLVNDRDSDFGQLARDIKDDPPATIILDPLRDYLPGDENSAKDVLSSLQCLSILRNLGECPLIAAHHLNRAGTMSGSRALKTRSDVFVEGTDDDEPSYRTIGRTIRRGDRIARSFVVTIEHEKDDDDTVAKTFVRARFEGESQPERSLSKSALRALDFLRANPGAHTKRAVRKALGGVNNRVVSGALEELRSAALADREGEQWTVSTSHFLATIGADGPGPASTTPVAAPQIADAEEEAADDEDRPF